MCPSKEEELLNKFIGIAFAILFLWLMWNWTVLDWFVVIASIIVVYFVLVVLIDIMKMRK
jgi:hypothetical protein